MSFDGLVMTRHGKAELIKATDEGSLNFTHIAFGDGVTNDLPNLKDELSHEIARLEIAEVERKDDRIILSLDYTNRSFAKGFYFRELGVIGNGELCYYDNAGSDAEYIDPDNDSVTKEKRLRIELIISDVVNVETGVRSDLYALKEDVERNILELHGQLGKKIEEEHDYATLLEAKIALNGCGETSGGKNLANFSKLGAKTTNGITFEYQSNGSIKVSGTVSKDDSVCTPLKLTKTRLSKGRWYTTSVKSSNPKSIAKLFFTDNGTATMLQMSETADTYYYLQFYDNANTNGKIPAGTVIDEVLYPQVEEGKVVTEYEPYFCSNQMLATEKADRSEITTNSLDCTMQYAEGHGLTVTRLNDGTYNIVGTATDNVVIPLTDQSDVLEVLEDSILLGCEGGSTVTYGLGVLKDSTYSEVFDGEARRLLAGTYDYAYIFVRNGVTINTVMKPMITTNIRATNYVPYTGDTGNIAKDVSHIRGKILDGVMTKKIQLVSDTRKDFVRTIEPIEGSEEIKIPPVIVSPCNNKIMDNTYGIGSSGGGGEIRLYSDYTYARSCETTFDILDVFTHSSVKKDGITATYKDAKSLSSDKKFYTVKGTATADTKINLYSVTAPGSEKIYFSLTALPAEATVDTYYVEISDAAGNVINVVGGETSKTMSTHSGKVTVCLVVKSGVKLTNVTVNVKAGYSKTGLVADFYPVKYSDTVDNVCDAVVDLKTRLDGMNKVVLSESITISSANTNYFLTMLGPGLYYLEAVASLGGNAYVISHIATVAIENSMPVIQLDDKTGPMMKFVSMKNPNAPNVYGLGINSQASVTAGVTIIKIV